MNKSVSEIARKILGERLFNSCEAPVNEDSVTLGEKIVKALQAERDKVTELEDKIQRVCSNNGDQERGICLDCGSEVLVKKNMNTPIPPKDFKINNFKDDFDSLPKCKHGMISGMCITCNPDLLRRNPTGGEEMKFHHMKRIAGVLFIVGCFVVLLAITIVMIQEMLSTSRVSLLQRL